MSILRTFRQIFDNFSNVSGTFRSFRLFEIFHETAWVAAIYLVWISSKSEPSSRFFDRLKIFDFRDVHYLLHALTIENAITPKNDSEL